VIRDALQRTVREALDRAGLPEPAQGIALDVPKQRDHGDWSTNVALQLQKQTGEKPRDLAQRIVDAINAVAPPFIERVDTAGPGFVNFFLAPSWLADVLREVVEADENYGRSDVLAGQRINLEFVSANPTGPLHAGGGRWVAVGDAIANLLESQGAEVHREYYLNDAGTQLDLFGASLYARYRDEPLPEDGYRGEYLVEMAGRMRAELGDDATLEQAREWGYHDVVRQLREDLGRIGVHFDTWFSERLLHERGDVDDVLREIRNRGIAYEHEGATWLRTTDYGDTRDRVIIRSNGTTTYLTNDLAYHLDKLRREWNHLIDIWGADHHGQVKSLQAGIEALGYGDAKAPEPEVILGQLVKLLRGGEEVRMSKRAGDIVTLGDILDEVDPDVARMTFLLQGIDSQQTFDLDVVTSQSMENPVYYVQYAHARVMSIARRAAEAGVTRRPIDEVDLSVLRHEREEALLRALSLYPEVVAEAAAQRAPQKVSTWVRDFAREFHGFYRDCRVLSDDATLTQARLWLTEACRIGLADALGLLGVAAPDEMARLDEDADTADANEDPA
jgi:arginyl-tRNA synthetase